MRCVGTDVAGVSIESGSHVDLVGSESATRSWRHCVAAVASISVLGRTWRDLRYDSESSYIVGAAVKLLNPTSTMTGESREDGGLLYAWSIACYAVYSVLVSACSHFPLAVKEAESVSLTEYNVRLRC